MKWILLFSMICCATMLLAQKANDNVVYRLGNVDIPPIYKCEECDSLTGKAKETCATSAMFKAFYENLRYPSVLKDTCFEGVMAVNMIINQNGHVEYVIVCHSEK